MAEIGSVLYMASERGHFEIPTCRLGPQSKRRASVFNVIHSRCGLQLGGRELVWPQLGSLQPGKTMAILRIKKRVWDDGSVG